MDNDIKDVEISQNLMKKLIGNSEPILSAYGLMK